MFFIQNQEYFKIKSQLKTKCHIYARGNIKISLITMQADIIVSYIFVLYYLINYDLILLKSLNGLLLEEKEWDGFKQIY